MASDSAVMLFEALKDKVVVNEQKSHVLATYMWYQ